METNTTLVGLTGSGEPASALKPPDAATLAAMPPPRSPVDLRREGDESES